MVDSFTLAPLLKPIAALARHAQKYSSEERTRAIISQQTERDADEIYVLVHRLIARLKRLGIDVEADAMADPATAAKAAEDYLRESEGAAPEKKDVLKRLTLRRFDPRTPRDVRSLWFDVAAQMTDYEVHALLLVRSGLISLWHLQGRAYYQEHREVMTWVQNQSRFAGEEERHRLPWSRADFADNSAALKYLAARHAMLVSGGELRSGPEWSVYRLTSEGARLIQAMDEYSDEFSMADSPSAEELS